jgi:hypothetical protein
MSDTDNTQTDSAKVTSSSDELPEWARKKLSEANAEAAKYRVKAQTVADEVRAELEQKHQAEFKSVLDEKSTVLSERDTATSNFDKLVVALQAGIPGESAVEFSKLLQGSNTEEFQAHAESLKKMFNPGTKPKATDPSQGLNGTSGMDPADALAELFKSHTKR